MIDKNRFKGKNAHQLCEIAIQLYSVDGRCYHNPSHLVAVMQQMNILSLPYDVDYTTLAVAALFHDAVYDPRVSANEYSSADLAVGILSATDNSSLAIECSRLIWYTEYKMIAESNEEKILHDADWYIFGEDTLKYLNYAANIRKEYSHVSDEKWREGRTNFLKGIVHPLFYLPQLEELNAQAKENIELELLMLERGLI